MAHEIESDDNIAWVSERPWHGLGIEVPGNLSAQEMLEVAGLDWEVGKYPIFASVGKERVRVTGKQALVRESDNKVLDVVGDDWEIYQNSEAFQFFHEFVSNGDMTMETAGSLRGGKYVWALARVNKEFSLFNGDQVLPYLLFTNPHHYAKTIDVRFTAVRTVCMNTLTLALEGKGTSFRVGHATKFDPDMAKEAVGLAASKLDNYAELAQFLGSKSFTEETVKEYFNAVFPVVKSKAPTKRKEKEVSLGAGRALLALENQPGAEFAAGTWWQAVNAVTYYMDHQQGRNDENRVESMWYGGNKDKKVKAFALAKEFAEAA